MPKKLDLDEPTRQLAERLLRLPPKSHDEMKVGHAKKRKVRKRKSQEK